MGAPTPTSSRALLFTVLHPGTQGKSSCEKGILLLKKKKKENLNRVNTRCVCLKSFPQITPQPSPSSLLSTQLGWTSPRSHSGHEDRDLYKPVPPLPPHRMLSCTFTVGTHPGAQTTICRTCRSGPVVPPVRGAQGGRL